MKISEMNAYVFDQCGKQSREVIDTHLLFLWNMSALEHYNRQLAASGKSMLATPIPFTPDPSRKGAVPGGVGVNFSEAQFVRRLVDEANDIWDFVEVVDDIQELQNAINSGRYAILFYGTPTQYYLSWEPSANEETLEIWQDRDPLDASGFGHEPDFPPRFHRMVATRATLYYAMPHLLMCDAKKFGAFVNMKATLLGNEIKDMEKDFDWYRFGSPGMGGSYQQEAFDPFDLD